MNRDKLTERADEIVRFLHDEGISPVCLGFADSMVLSAVDGDGAEVTFSVSGECDDAEDRVIVLALPAEIILGQRG